MVKRRRGKDPVVTESPAHPRSSPAYIGWRTRPYTPSVWNTLALVGLGNGEMESPSFSTAEPPIPRPAIRSGSPSSTSTPSRASENRGPRKTRKISANCAPTYTSPRSPKVPSLRLSFTLPTHDSTSKPPFSCILRALPAPHAERPTRAIPAAERASGIFAQERVVTARGIAVKLMTARGERRRRPATMRAFAIGDIFLRGRFHTNRNTRS
mmetsp:Transcript_30115/g.71315  ORF Transcript_30115/g.71315 Transcript_30115/m.71315 type:complete len:211 (-) Transcript_30115:19-651(-)